MITPMASVWVVLVVQINKKVTLGYTSLHFQNKSVAVESLDTTTLQSFGYTSTLFILKNKKIKNIYYI